LGGGSDDDFRTVEESLYATLRESSLTAADSSLDNTALRVDEAAFKERGGFVDHGRSASGDDSSASLLDKPIDLHGDQDLSLSEVEVDNSDLWAKSAAPDAGIFNSLKTAVDSMTSAPPSSPSGWHDSVDFSEAAQPAASMSN
jgi:hypothetical protein